MERIAIVQKYNDSAGIHEKVCFMLACAGSSAGFDIMGMHKDRFYKKLLTECDLIVVTDILDLHAAQKKELMDIIINIKPLFVRCVMDLSEIENNAVDIKLYKLSKKNYFCSPAIFKEYIELEVDGDLSFLAGKIDDSWNKISDIDKDIDEKEKRARMDFWRDINMILSKERTLNDT